jgi:hypothetical protein
VAVELFPGHLPSVLYRDFEVGMSLADNIPKTNAAKAELKGEMSKRRSLGCARNL